MHDPIRGSGGNAASADKPTLYADLSGAVDALLEGETDPVANAANAAAAIYHGLPGLNWAGFYYVRGQALVLGPFQGKPACIRLPLVPPLGVCATAVVERRSVLVRDVMAFAGHVACDPASRAELVTPITVGGRIVAVLDLDSPEPGRFDGDDQRGLEAIAAVLARHLGHGQKSRSA